MSPARKRKIALGTRLSLVLSLTIASSLTARVAQAEPTSPYRCTQVLTPTKTTPKKNRTKKKKLGQTITKLVKLSPAHQELVDQAIDRAIAAQISDSATTVEQPVRRIIGARG